MFYQRNCIVYPIHGLAAYWVILSIFGDFDDE